MMPSNFRPSLFPLGSVLLLLDDFNFLFFGFPDDDGPRREELTAGVVTFWLFNKSQFNFFLSI